MPILESKPIRQALTCTSYCVKQRISALVVIQNNTIRLNRTHDIAIRAVLESRVLTRT